MMVKLVLLCGRFLRAVIAMTRVIAMDAGKPLPE